MALSISPFPAELLAQFNMIEYANIIYYHLVSAYRKGVISVFDLSKMPAHPVCQVGPINKHRYNNQFARQCAFSEDGSILIAVDDTSSVVQYERT